jgi:hypothetical protein
MRWLFDFRFFCYFAEIFGLRIFVLSNDLDLTLA